MLNAQGLTDVKVIGIDGHPQAIAEVSKPEGQMIATVAQPFEGMARRSENGFRPSSSMASRQTR